MDPRIERIYKEVITNEKIKKFIVDNELTKEDFANNLRAFRICYQENEICNSCNGKECHLEYQYMKSFLTFDKGAINITYQACPYESNLNDRLQTVYFPKMENIENMEIFEDPERAKALSYIIAFLENPKSKGVYIHGKYGTGKTFILYKVATNLAGNGKNVIIANYPDLVRYLKSCISDGTLEREIVRLKKIDVLMLDDIGGENNTAYVRDEILCPILQYRLLENKPVFMTSNYDLKLLRDHFMETKDDINTVASDRIIERIKALMHDVELKGNVYRK